MTYTSRRAALIGTIAALATPAAGGPDAGLLALCAAAGAALAACDPFPPGTTDEEVAAADDRYTSAVEAALDVPAATMAGMQAKAGVALDYAAITVGPEEEQDFSDQVVMRALGDLAGREPRQPWRPPARSAVDAAELDASAVPPIPAAGLDDAPLLALLAEWYALSADMAEYYRANVSVLPPLEQSAAERGIKVEYDRRRGRLADIEDRITETPARTVAGLLEKARLAHAEDVTDMLNSVARDLLAFPSGLPSWILAVSL